MYLILRDDNFFEIEERRKGFDECGVRSLADRTILFFLWDFCQVAVACSSNWFRSLLLVAKDIHSPDIFVSSYEICVLKMQQLIPVC